MIALKAMSVRNQNNFKAGKSLEEPRVDKAISSFVKMTDWIREILASVITVVCSFSTAKIQCSSIINSDTDFLLVMLHCCFPVKNIVEKIGYIKRMDSIKF